MFPSIHVSTAAEERALLILVSAGDRCAMDELYIRYFARLVKFFQNVTLRAEVAEELVNDTMLEVWKTGESIRENAHISPAIMGLAYVRVQRYFADARARRPYSQCDVSDCQQSQSGLTGATRSGLENFLSKLSVEERAVLHLVYANGCSRRETADVMKIACDGVDGLLRAVRANAKLYYGSAPAD